MSAPERAPLGAALAMLLTVVSLTGAHSPVLMAGAIGVLSVLLAISWPELLELPSAIGTRLVMGAAGIAGAGLALLTGQDVTGASAVVMVCGAGVFAAFVHQMLRRDRHRLTASLTGTVSRSEEHTSELQSRGHLVCRLLLEKKNRPAPHANEIVAHTQ